MSIPKARLALLIGINQYANRPPSDHLRGAVNDVQRMASLLEDRFGFCGSDLQMLLDGDATKKGILQALDDLGSSVSPGCCVVLHWSGHGSQMPSPPSEDGRVQGHDYDETLVPYDARKDEIGDLTDKDFLRLFSRLEQRGAVVTWIVDACHSGHLYRNSRYGRARHLPPAMPVPDRCRPTLTKAFVPVPRQPRRRVLLAACHHTEVALERPIVAREHFGEWTYALTAALETCSQEATVREVFDDARLRLAREGVYQNPRMVGDRDRLIFGVRARPPVRYLEIRARDEASLELAGGDAHGLCRGAQWNIFPSRTYDPEKGRFLARAEIREVAATTSRAALLSESEAAPRTVQSGDWAFEHQPAYGELRLVVHFVGETSADLGSELVESVERSPVLCRAETEESADVVVSLSAGGGEVDLIDPRGFPLLMDDEDLERAALERIARRLERHARARLGRRLVNKEPRSRLQGRLSAHLLRQISPDRWEAASTEESSGIPRYEAGELIAVEISHEFPGPLYIYVLDFGLTDRVSQVFPTPGGEELLDPGRPLGAGTLCRDELELFLAGAEGGRGCLKVIATTRPTCFDWLRTDILWPGAHRSPTSSLESLLSMGSSVPKIRRDDEDWGCLDCPFILQSASSRSARG